MIYSKAYNLFPLLILFSVIRLLHGADFEDVNDDKFTKLYDQLFNEHYDILGIDKTYSLLKEIEPLIKSNDIETNELVSQLIKANNVNEENCTFKDRFFETFSILYKQQFSGQKVFGPNININDYLEKLRTKQVELCSRLLLNYGSKLTQNDLKLMSEIVSNLQGFDSLEKEAHKAIIKTMSNHIKQSTNIMDRFGEGRKRKLLDELENVSAVCQRVDSLLKNFDETIRTLVIEDNPNEPRLAYKENIFANEKLMSIIKFDRLCSLYLHGELVPGGPINGVTRTTPLKEHLTKVVMRD